MTRPTEEAFAAHKLRKTQEVHKKENTLRDVILGGQDGLVNALGIILGVLAASGSPKVLITTIIAATIAESISMGAVAYTSALAQKDYYSSERRKEEREIDKYPQMETEEVRRIYESKGVSGKALDEIVDAITSDKNLWVDTMMAEELQIQPVDTNDALKSAVVVTIATVVGHLIPASPFFFALANPLLLAITISTLALFATGAYQALTLVGSWWKTGLRMVLIGMGAALAGYIIARIFGTTV